MRYMGLKICMGNKTHRYYKHNKFHQIQEVTLNLGCALVHEKMHWLFTIFNNTTVTFTIFIFPTRWRYSKEKQSDLLYLHGFRSKFWFSHCNSWYSYRWTWGSSTRKDRFQCWVLWGEATVQDLACIYRGFKDDVQ